MPTASGLTESDIRRVVSSGTYLAGRDYLAEGRVRNVTPLPDGGTVVARVQGTKRSPYSVVIRFTRNRHGELAIANTCTCPVGRNCKHVAAVLIATLPARPSRATGAIDLAKPAPPTPELNLWLQALQSAQETNANEAAQATRSRLFYLLQAGRAPGSLRIDPALAELRRDGTPLRATPLSPRELLGARHAADILRDVDRGILRRISAFGSEPDEEFIETLRRILSTGRARWQSSAGTALSEGPAIRSDVYWQAAEDGSQRPELQLPQGVKLLRFTRPWYADIAAGQLGPIEVALPSRLVQALLAAPAVPPEMVQHVAAEITRRLPGVAVQLPTEVKLPPLIDEKPVPVLSLFAGIFPPDAMRHAQLLARTRRGEPRPELNPTIVPIARLAFQYGPVTLPAAQSGPRPTSVTVDGQRYRIRRDDKAEDAAMAALGRLMLRPATDHLAMPVPAPLRDTLALAHADPAAWIDFMADDVPALRAQGWTVSVSDDFPVRFARLSGDISVEISEGSGIDWFEFELGAVVDGEQIDLLPALLALIRNERLSAADSDAELDDAERWDDEEYWHNRFVATDDESATPTSDEVVPDDDAAETMLPLPDGRILPIPLAKLRPLLNIILELFEGQDAGPGRLRLPRQRLTDLALAEAASEGIVWRGGEGLRELGRQLRAAEGIPSAVVPAAFTADLRPYQARGVDWLQFLRQAGLGGVLADEMGLGKTVQTLAHIVIERAAGRLDRPALVVCPTSLVANWCAEAGRFAPTLRVLALHGPERRAQFDSIVGHDLVITTYPLLARDTAVLTERDWHLVILDEAQTIKNPQSGTTKLAHALRGRQRLCLTGTPLENHLGELWSLFDFMMPGFLGDARRFQRHWRTPIERGADLARRDLLSQRITPFLLRRTKAEVAADLPPKSEIIEPIEMGPAQRAVYEGIRLTMHAKVKQAVAARGLARSGIIILDALLKLRQACCDPRLLKLKTVKASSAKSAKLARLLEMLPELLEEGRRVLLFSQFTSMLALIEEALDKARIRYVILTGETTDRATPIRQFTSGDVPLFLISLKAGGVGLNLTAADTVIHYDPWWNPAVEAQATDRAHRIGQTRPVFVHRLITRGTIEEKMEALKARKQALVAGILGEGDGRALALTEADIDMLFAPLPE